MRVLIVEDNLNIQANIADYLKDEYILDFAYNGSQGLELALSNEYDVIVLDLMLPGKDGIEICREYRAKTLSQVPILMLTARDTIDDKAVGFEAGTDDYMVKPFSLRELKMRIDALARRGKMKGKTVFEYAGVSLRVEASELAVGEQSIQLHEKEARILELLLEAAPDIVATKTVSHALWGDEPPDSGALRTHVYNLRQALAKLGQVDLLRTVRGRGYHLRKDES